MKRMSFMMHDNTLYMEAEGRTTDWEWYFTGPVVKVSMAETDEVIGKAFLEVLESSQLDIPKPDVNYDPGEKAIAAGFKSFVKFAQESKAVSVEEMEEGIEFLPSTWGGAREGYLHLEEKAFFHKDKVPENVGKAVRKALEFCGG